jgi:hydrogenase large subunit
VVEVIRQTKQVLEIVAIVGGQWPHSSYMVPGGIASRPSASQLRQCRLLLRKYREWYEQRVLGCSVERWLELRSAAELDAWLEQSAAHRESHLGLFIRFARAIGLDRVGRGHDSFLCYGGLQRPAEEAEPESAAALLPAGFLRQGTAEPFDPSQIGEHVAHSWYVDYEGGRHPLAGETRPYATGEEGAKYSWAKAPRYADQPAETGPLAQGLIAGDALLGDLVATRGTSAFVRQLARLTRPCRLMPAMDTWIDETRSEEQAAFYRPPAEAIEGEGWGLVEATRGALGHWVRIANGEIAHYQIITPTAWNASPRDAQDVRGPMEQALVGLAVRDSDNPVEIGHVVRSFDPCLVCTVHLLDLRRPARTTRRSLAI